MLRQREFDFVKGEEALLIGKRKQLGRRWLAAYVLLAAIVVGAVAHAAIARQLNDWKLLPQPERFTELYFANAAALPATYTPGATQTVAFTAHNVEHRTTAYTYVITAAGADANDATQTLATGTFTLGQDQTRTTKATVTLPALGTHELITVSLTNVSTSIDFWLTQTEAKQ